ncbi:hypothetical protein FDECE_5687 [Fusarium decemcellulare]|nr:hypothetical protein FDECE_5687 [Fusarium decemcellulare]
MCGEDELSPSEADIPWSNDQTCEFQLIQVCSMLAHIRGQLGIPSDIGAVSGLEDWKDTATDFKAIHTHFENLLQQIRASNSSFTGYISILNAKQASEAQKLALVAAELSVKEAKRARALVLVGLVFIPLLLVSSLFSMSEPYSPGHSRFWVYFVVSVPLAMLTVATYFVYDRDMFEWRQWIKWDSASSQANEKDLPY